MPIVTVRIGLFLALLLTPAVAHAEESCEGDNEPEVCRAAKAIGELEATLRGEFASRIGSEEVKGWLTASDETSKDIISDARARLKAKELLGDWNEYDSGGKLDKAVRFVREGAKLQARAALTNNDGDQTSASGARIDLDKTIFDGGFDIGYFKRPIARDIWLRVSPERREKYARWKKGSGKRDWENFANWAVIDAIKLDLNGGWGTVINDPQGDDNSTTDKRGVYRVGLSWEIPLSESNNPFD